MADLQDEFLTGAGLSKESWKKLLGLYSLPHLKRWSELKARTKADLASEAIDTFESEELQEFAREYHPTTRNHLYLFEHNTEADLSRGPLQALCVNESSSAASRSWFYFKNLRYVITLREPLEELEVSLPWPIMVTVADSRLQVRLTTMEQSVARKFAGARKVARVARGATEATILNEIRDNWALKELKPLDLHEGVKALWKSSKIDALSVNSMKDVSKLTQNMNADFLLKRDDPAEYAKVLNRPLRQCAFEWTGSNIGVQRFLVDPTKGMLIFSSYSDLEKGSSYVVGQILGNSGRRSDR